MTMSLSTTHLLIGTHTGEIHIYALPSHQHLRTLSSHSSPVTHISTTIRPPDMIGSQVAKKDEWPLMEIKPLERMRAGRVAREVQEATIVLGRRQTDRLNSLRPSGSAPLVAATRAGGIEASSSDRVAELEAENKRLKANLDKAVKLNEKMWNGIVDMRLGDQPAQ